MLNPIPCAKLHGPALLALFANALTTFATKVALTCALAIPTILNRLTLAFLLMLMGGFVCVVAVQAGNKHHHYRLVDLGTLGGPHSYGAVNGEGFALSPTGILEPGRDRHIGASG